MRTRNLVLTKHHQEVIEQLVKLGRYHDASEVLHEGLRLVEEREAREAARLAELRKAARIGFQDIEDGRFQDVPDEELDDFIGGLGGRGSVRARSARLHRGQLRRDRPSAPRVAGT